MGITEFRTLIVPANKAEEIRLKHLTTRQLKFLTKNVVITAANASQLWPALNKELADQESYHKKEKEAHKKWEKTWAGRNYEDYSDVAYNNHTDDL